MAAPTPPRISTSLTDTTCDVTSADVNAYLREITGQDITAKDFRTWAGTVLAAMALQEFEAFDSQAKAKKNLRAAIERVAARLGNTPTVCRACYIHPQVLDCYVEGALLLQVKDAVEEELRDDLGCLRPEEAAVLGLLQSRLSVEGSDRVVVSPNLPSKRKSKLTPSGGNRAANGSAQRRSSSKRIYAEA